MLIHCPQCGFERTFDPADIPATAFMATCPQCHTRFRFRDTPPKSAQPAPADTATARTTTEPSSEFTAGEQSASAVIKRPGSRPPLVDSLEESSSETKQDQTTTGPAGIQSSQAKPAEQFEGDDPLPPGAIIGPSAKGTTDPYIPSSDTSRKPDASSRATHKNTESRNPESIRSIFSGNGPSEIIWETAQLAELPKALYQTILQVLFAAPAFFTSVGKSKAVLFRPCLFYLLIGLFQGIVEHFWFMAKLNELAQDANMQASISALSQSVTLPMLLVIMPPLLLIQLFIYAGLFNLMIRLIQPDRSNFTTTLRVVAYSAAPGFLCIVPVVGAYVATLWFAICCFVGCKHAHKLSWMRTAMAILPLYVLSIAISLHMGRVIAQMFQ